MKTTFTIEVSDEESDLPIQKALRAQDTLSVLFEFDNWLRSEIKYGDKNELDPARKKLYELINEAGIYDLIFS